jgi:hypothetical protein
LDEVAFWILIQSAHDASGGDMNKKCEAIKASIAKLTKNDALEFFRIFQELRQRAFSWPLWGAAYVIHGGCGDDSFDDFRTSLISRGRLAYEKAMADPDSLADDDIDEETWFFEGFQYAVRQSVEAVAGPSIPNVPHPLKPTGTQWLEDEVYKLFPKLAKLFA